MLEALGFGLGITILIIAFAAWIILAAIGGIALYDGKYLKCSILLSAWVVLSTISIGLIAYAVQTNEATHGSCRIGHYQWTGKSNSFMCDEYYPLPEGR